MEQSLTSADAEYRLINELLAALRVERESRLVFDSKKVMDTTNADARNKDKFSEPVEEQPCLALDKSETCQQHEENIHNQNKESSENKDAYEIQSTRMVKRRNSNTLVPTTSKENEASETEKTETEKMSSSKVQTWPSSKKILLQTNFSGQKRRNKNQFLSSDSGSESNIDETDLANKNFCIRKRLAASPSKDIQAIQIFDVSSHSQENEDAMVKRRRADISSDEGEAVENVVDGLVMFDPCKKSRSSFSGVTNIVAAVMVGGDVQGLAGPSDSAT